MRKLARYYDPSIGAFINQDPAKDGANWYVYCGGNPINRWDPSGMSWWNPFSKDSLGARLGNWFYDVTNSKKKRDKALNNAKGVIDFGLDTAMNAMDEANEPAGNMGIDKAQSAIELALFVREADKIKGKMDKDLKLNIANTIAFYYLPDSELEPFKSKKIDMEAYKKTRENAFSGLTNEIWRIKGDSSNVRPERIGKFTMEEMVNAINSLSSEEYKEISHRNLSGWDKPFHGQIMKTYAKELWRKGVDVVAYLR